MKKTQKREKGILGGRVDERNRVETAGVAVLGKSVKASPLAEYQFKPGNCANPLGRPKTSDLKAAVREFADEEDPTLRKTRLRQWMEMADRRARQGSPKHLEMLLAYGWGRPAQAIELAASVNYGDALNKAKARHEANERQKLAALTPKERQTLDALNSKMGKALLPAAAPTNGHSTPQEAQAAALLPDQDLSTAREDDAEQITAAPAKQKIQVEL